jgi:uncharacterized repeat protein (TIGR02543 family)
MNKYKFDIQLFAGSSITTSTEFPDSDQVRIYFNVSDLQSYLQSNYGSDVYIVQTDTDGFNFIVSDYGSTEVPMSSEFQSFIVNGTEIYRYTYNGPPEPFDNWYSTYETDGYIDIDMSSWSEAKRTVSSVDATYLTNMGITWEDMNATSTWTVTYDSNGGSAVTAEEDIEDGGYAEEPSDPTRSNYTFAGWFTDDDTFADEWDFETDTVTEDITLYAKWTQSVENKFTQWGRAVHARLTAVETPETETEDANYTLALTDAGKVILAGHATNAVKITIPLNSAVAFPTNTEIAVVRYLAGVVTIGTSNGATLNGVAYTTTFTLGDRYTSVAIKKVGTDAWIMSGNFEETA